MPRFWRLRRWLADFSSLFLIDHGFLRAVWANRYRLPGGLYRANQPSPRMIRRYRRRLGIRTIINLRGENQEHGFYRLEEAACIREDVHLVNIKTKSRGLMSVEALESLKQIIETVDLPALAHCKSGADRAGFFSVLWRHWRLGEPIELAVSELDWRYGHFKSAKTGQLDSFFETYLVSRQPGQSLIDWIREDYDPRLIRRNFHPKPWVSWFVDDFLGRE
jgi:protein tyrosine phosphatase (PTP) superfamily phosphohydrolase (DUF442 family)